MAKIKRNCDKCSNRVGDWCTMQKDKDKAYSVLCDGFKIVPKNPRPIFKEVTERSLYVANKEVLGSNFYNFLKRGGAWSLDPKNPGRIF